MALFVLSFCPFDISVGVGAFVTDLFLFLFSENNGKCIMSMHIMTSLMTIIIYNFLNMAHSPMIHVYVINDEQ